MFKKIVLLIAVAGAVGQINAAKDSSKGGAAKSGKKGPGTRKASIDGVARSLERTQKDSTGELETKFNALLAQAFDATSTALVEGGAWKDDAAGTKTVANLKARLNQIKENPADDTVSERLQNILNDIQKSVMEFNREHDLGPKGIFDRKNKGKKGQKPERAGKHARAGQESDDDEGED